MPLSPSALRLYLVMGSQDCRGRDPAWILQEAIAGGVTLFQFREKDSSLSMTQTVSLGKQLRELCAKYRIPFIVNDRVDLAMILDADGVHLGQDDLPPVEVRPLLETNALIGISTETPEEAKAAAQAGADYLGVGAMYATRSKPDAGKPIGPEGIRRINCKVSHPLPVVGIGGIDGNNAKEVIQAGAAGIAVISAITHADSPRRAAAELREIVERSRLKS
ncbi:MAG: thiamine phosphate synthase [Firmicutes bacterium]|uniref:Thiamine-phosphate synthase n=1 Tax=Melghirimyces thermohalophilus TaxID=1236220 RepID=A0A1G6MS06_9BACL|nr:thiamine phosphate synthase [Melghirimyces thermohalophilus]MDA8354551.1 thiamine phosphate synthase [Bacillota bacterium]SDC57755.1 thiamine-phosphate pyrophosphorylase [Melghirimyces thermohalophilus]